MRIGADSKVFRAQTQVEFDPIVKHWTESVMNELKTSTKVVLASAIVTLVILLAGPLGYKFGLVGLMPSLVSLLVALLGAVIVFLVGLALIVVAQKNGQGADRTMLAVAIVVSLIPMVAMGPQIAKAQSVPPIHDITTDTEQVPQFDVIVQQRVGAPNSLVYGSEQLPREELAALQLKAYPGVQPRTVQMNVADAAARAEQVLAAMGLEVVNVDAQAGLVEATATTFWFGFKDDMVVRLTAADAETRIDVRSVSRVGQSDVGANAARIEKFLAAF